MGQPQSRRIAFRPLSDAGTGESDLIFDSPAVTANIRRIAAEARGSLRHFPALDNKRATVRLPSRSLIAPPRWMPTLNSMRCEGVPESRKLAAIPARQPRQALAGLRG